MRRLLFACLLTLAQAAAVQAAPPEHEHPNALVLGAVAKTFPDPASVRFGPAFYPDPPGHSSRHLCIRANSKNAYGVYAGEQLMVYSIGVQENPNVAPWVLLEASERSDITGVSRVCLSPKDRAAIGWK